MPVPMSGTGSLARCGHICAHPKALPVYIDVRGALRAHIKEGVHEWCTERCPMFSARETGMLVDASPDDMKRFFREIWELLSKTTNRAPNKARLQYLEKLRSDPTWSLWVNAADTLPHHPQSVFSDGHFCVHYGKNWAVDFDNERPFFPRVVGPGEAHPPPFDVFNAQHGMDPYAPATLAPSVVASPAAPPVPPLVLPSQHRVQSPLVPREHASPSFEDSASLQREMSLSLGDVSPLQSPSAQHTAGRSGMRRSPSVGEHMERLSVQPNVAQPLLPVRFIDSAKRTASFPRHPHAALPKSVIWAIWLAEDGPNLWDKDVRERMEPEHLGLPYFTHIKADLSDPLAMSWDQYIRSLPFMCHHVWLNGRLDEKLAAVYGDTTVGYYLHEWVSFLRVFTFGMVEHSCKIEVSRRLWLKGVDIVYMPLGPFLYSIGARNPKDKTWLLAKEADVIMLGRSFFGTRMRSGGGDATSGWAGQDALRVLKSIQDWTEAGKFIWPHPDTVSFAARKSINTLLYGDPMMNGGGVTEAPIYVQTKESGIEMLRSGSHVIKGDWSDEYTNIYMPTSSLNKSGKGARKAEGDPIQRFSAQWDRVAKHHGDPFFPRLFAIPYNDAIISLGEVRVFFANGRILDMLHTIPGVLDAPQWEVQRVSAIRTAPVKNIK